MYTYKLRRDFAIEWQTINPILAQGEPGYEFDTGKLKIGDGVRVWTALPYLVETTNLQAHVVSTANPHGVTKAQVGLADVANTSDADKPISVLQQTALDLKLASDHVSVTNARAPTSHKTSHATGGSDALTPANIGAVASATITTIVVLTQAERTALGAGDPVTLYVVSG